MIDAASLIQDLKALLDNCGVVEGLDEAVEYRSNKSRREAAVEAIDEIVQTIDEAYRRLALIPQLTGTYLVHSRTNAMGGANISVEPDTNIQVGLDSLGDGWVNKIDSGVNRYTYYSEFGGRVVRLREEILKGNLDTVLGHDPNLILHGISGLGWELLPALGLDPFKGETFNRFANDPLRKTLMDLEANNADLTKTIEEVGNDFQNIVKAIFAPRTIPAASTMPPSNVIEITDYKVHPKTPTAEEARELDKLPGAKAAVKAIRIEKQLTRDRYEGETSKEEKRVAATPNELEIPIGVPTGDSIGIEGFTVNDQIRGHMELGDEVEGVLVIRVLPNSLAEKAGLRAGNTQATFNGIQGTLGGDIITGIEDEQIKSTEELAHYLGLYHIKGTKIKFNVIRNGKPVDIEIVY